MAVRDTHGTDDKNPLPYLEVKQRVETGLRAYAGHFVVVALPNTHVLDGRDVGCAVERVTLDTEVEAISATEIWLQWLL